MVYCSTIASPDLPEAHASGAGMENGYSDDTSVAAFNVPAMHCAGCMRTLEKGLLRHPDIDTARANLSTRQVSVTWRGEALNPQRIEDAISDLGFESHTADQSGSAVDPVRSQGKQLLLCLAVAGFASANIMLLSVSVWSGAESETARLFSLISGLIAVPAVIFSGRPFFASALKALGSRRLNMDVPISLAILLSLLMSFYEALYGSGEVYFEAGVMLLFFLLIGRTLDHFMREKAASGVQNLMGLVPRTANRIDKDGTTAAIPVEDIKAGDHLRILPGDRFPVDARIISGNSNVDRSIVTGEEEPLLAGPGTELESGTLSLDGVLDIEASTCAQQSFLAEVKSMMRAAESSRGKYRRIADRMAEIYAPAVHLLAFLAFIGWMIATRDLQVSLTIAIAVLIITCPCALGLAVPVSHVAAANRLFGEGILMRDGSALERLSEVDQVFFDKTGTLTNTTITLKTPPCLPAEKARLLGAMASLTRHPIGVALTEYYGKPDTNLPGDVKEIPGFGIEAVVDGKRVRLGRPGWADQIAAHRHDNTEDSVLFVLEDGKTHGFRFAADLRPGAHDCINEVEKLGLPAKILSGDLQENVANIASQIGLTNWQGELTPAEKVSLVKKAQEGPGKVLMVGDGLNDAPSLATAHVSISLATAAEVSRNCADFVLTRNNLKGVSFALSLAQATAKIVRTNFALAIAYNCIAVPLAVAGHVTPLFAALAMSASSVVVVLNSSRLLAFGRQEKPASNSSDQRNSVVLSDTATLGANP